ncbi:hypothetical protein MAIT1_00239 [Magnetofaba australis IT-1]|uniref:Uncharacterized protein n=1 Tax=Magnetofaba australis IT-1 TaxID=1434232 RepID=A0A1Y2K822_9PROT|nr:hypothetical protein MAIT1_00239 [Magnetofaba australis IT-1]
MSAEQAEPLQTGVIVQRVRPLGREKGVGEGAQTDKRQGFRRSPGGAQRLLRHALGPGQTRQPRRARLQAVAIAAQARRAFAADDAARSRLPRAVGHIVVGQQRQGLRLVAFGDFAQSFGVAQQGFDLFGARAGAASGDATAPFAGLVVEAGHTAQDHGVLAFGDHLFGAEIGPGFGEVQLVAHITGGQSGAVCAQQLRHAGLQAEGDGVQNGAFTAIIGASNDTQIRFEIDDELIEAAEIFQFQSVDAHDGSIVRDVGGSASRVARRRGGVKRRGWESEKVSA